MLLSVVHFLLPRHPLLSHQRGRLALRPSAARLFGSSLGTFGLLVVPSPTISGFPSSAAWIECPLTRGQSTAKLGGVLVYAVFTDSYPPANREWLDRTWMKGRNACPAPVPSCEGAFGRNGRSRS